MDKKIKRLAGLLALTLAWAGPSAAATPREIMTQASFQTADKASALGLINQALAAADAILAQNPQDKEAQMQRGVTLPKL